jgi:hypothetical protein
MMMLLRAMMMFGRRVKVIVRDVMMMLLRAMMMFGRRVKVIVRDVMMMLLRAMMMVGRRVKVIVRDVMMILLRTVMMLLWTVMMLKWNVGRRSDLMTGPGSRNSDGGARGMAIDGLSDLGLLGGGRTGARRAEGAAVV